MKKKNIIVIFGLCSLAILATSSFLIVNSASTKPSVVKKETTVIIKKEKDDDKKKDELKSFGTGILGGFIGGTLGSRITGARERKEAVVTGKVTDRERRLIESYAHLEDDYTNLDREMIRMKRRAIALEAEVDALRANNRDLKQDLEKSRSKKKRYKKIAIEKRDESEQLRAELEKYKPEGPATPPAATSIPQGAV